MEEVFHAANARRALPKAWSRVAARQEGEAEKALAAGRPCHGGAVLPPRHALLRPGAASSFRVDGHPRKIEYYNGVARCRAKLIELMDGAMSKQDIPFEGWSVGIHDLQEAPGEGRKPTVLYIPGMDATKEDYPSPYNNEFVRRGMNVCSMDGPGQGEVQHESGLAHAGQPCARRESGDRLAGHTR